jgi:hypothetical protein
VPSNVTTRLKQLEEGLRTKLFHRHSRKLLLSTGCCVEAAHLCLRGRGVAGDHHRQSAVDPGYFDVALRDFGLFLGALALARLSHQFARSDKR